MACLLITRIFEKYLFLSLLTAVRNNHILKFFKKVFPFLQLKTSAILNELCIKNISLICIMGDNGINFPASNFFFFFNPDRCYVSINQHLRTLRALQRQIKLIKNQILNLESYNQTYIQLIQYGKKCYVTNMDQRINAVLPIWTK